MNATEATRVEMDDHIRQQPELCRAANEAMAYVLGQIEGVPPPAVIRWRFVPSDPNLIELSMTEEWQGIELNAAPAFPVRDMADPVNRDIWASRTFRRLLRERSRVNMAKIDRLLGNINRPPAP